MCTSLSHSCPSMRGRGTNPSEGKMRGLRRKDAAALLFFCLASACSPYSATTAEPWKEGIPPLWGFSGRGARGSGRMLGCSRLIVPTRRLGLRGGAEAEGSFTLGGGGISVAIPAAEKERIEKRKKERRADLEEDVRRWGRTVSISQGAGCSKVWIIGGRVGEVTVFGVNDVKCWGEGGESWEEMPMMTRPRILCAAAALNGRIYVSGGWHTTLSACNQVQSISIDGKGGFEDAPPMAKNRSAHALAALGDYLYASGGWDEQGEIRRSVERWRPGMKCWEKCGSMKIGRCYHGMAAIGGRLVIAGGQTDGIVPKQKAKSPQEVVLKAMMGQDAGGEPELDADAQTMLDSCEIFDPETNTWLMMECKMSKRRMSFQLVVHKGKLYAVGGCDQQGPPPLPEPDEIDPDVGEVHQSGYYARLHSRAPPLSVSRPGWVGREGKLPGEYCEEDDRRLRKDFDEVYVGSSVDVFDPASLEWSLMPSKLVSARAELGACSIGGTLYAFGGIDDAGGYPGDPNDYNATEISEREYLRNPEYQDTVERYNEDKGVWEMVEGMTMGEPRGSFACVAA